MIEGVGSLIAQWGSLIGWAALIGIAWRLRGVVEQQVNLWKGIDQKTSEAVKQVSVVKDKVDTLQTNHMHHIQSSLEGISRSNDKAVEVLQDMSQNIAVLVDRGSREVVVETKIRHIENPKKEE